MEFRAPSQTDLGSKFQLWDPLWAHMGLLPSLSFTRIWDENPTLQGFSEDEIKERTPLVILTFTGHFPCVIYSSGPPKKVSPAHIPYYRGGN